jgi:hypothetical protein
VELAAGHDHTVGLMPDGSVVAMGANAAGQCDVSTWNLGPRGGPAEINGAWSSGFWYWNPVVQEEWMKMASYIPSRDLAAGDATGD